jgi:hypothetical protein
MTANTGSAYYEELAKRVAELERQLKRMAAKPGAGKQAARPDLFCAVPELPPRELGPNVSAERARLIRYGGRKWVNGTTLHYYFFEDDRWGAGTDQKDLVREGFDVWKDVGIGLNFVEVSSADDAEVRIGFQQGDGYWSYVGTDVLGIGQAERTMNFGQDLTQDRRGVDVPVHEIGHTLGFPHEHQNPFAGITWDEDAVYAYFGGPPNNWDRDTIDHNILRKIPQGQVEGSEWDPDSIMHYAFEAGLIAAPAQYVPGLFPAAGLSETDKQQARFFYPPIAVVYPELRPYESQRLSLSPGEQKDFTIRPAATREYRIQTFGYTDSVMVLFEEHDGDFQFVAGDDDSGWDRNARLQLRLYAGRTYALRIRLYYQWASGDMAVLLW